jgi:hypothetical protein
MKYYKWFPLLILVIIQSGCGSNQILTKINSTDCTTTIEGNFITPKVYKNYAPVVLLTKDNKLPYISGAVIGKNKNGVFIIRKNYSFMDSPDTLFIEYPKIRAIVDSNYFCVYGDIDKKECTDMSLKFYLENLNEPEDEPIYLKLVSNNKFSFCVKPGKYRVVKIVRELSIWGDEYYESFPVFNSIIHADVNRANYIGDITMTAEKHMNNDAVILPYFKYVKGEDSFTLFSKIAKLVAPSSQSSWKDKIRGYYYLTISTNDNFKADSKNILNNCPLKIDVEY